MTFIVTTESAVLRCPVEVWSTILEAVLMVPNPCVAGLRFMDRFVSIHGRVIPLVEAENEARRNALVVGRQLLLVCRSWKRLVQPHLVQTLRIWSDGSMGEAPSAELLLDKVALLSRILCGRVMVSYVRSLSVQIGPSWVPPRGDDVITLLGLCDHIETFDVHLPGGRDHNYPGALFGALRTNNLKSIIVDGPQSTLR